MTYRIENWSTYHDDAVVLAWKTGNEAVAGSTNRRTLLSARKVGVTRALYPVYRSSLTMARDRDYHLAPLVRLRVRSVKIAGPKATVVTCVWNPDIDFRHASGKAVVPSAKKWIVQRAGLRRVSDRWLIDSVTFGAHCPGKRPA